MYKVPGEDEGISEAEVDLKRDAENWTEITVPQRVVLVWNSYQQIFLVYIQMMVGCKG